MNIKEKNTKGSGNLKVRHKKRVRRRNASIAAKRVVIFVLIVVVTLTIVLYLNPMFNIRQVIYEGNSRVSADYLDTYCQDIIGENIFHVSEKSLMELFKPINYISEVSVKKKYFPPTLKVIISEAIPYGCVKIGEKYIMFDRNFKNLEESTAFIDGAPRIYGLEDIAVEDFVIGSGNKKISSVEETLTAMAQTGVLEKTDEVSFNNISNITFEYDEKYHVILGSVYDIESKLLLFMATINSADISTTTGGTVDLSTAGTAYLRS